MSTGDRAGLIARIRDLPPCRRRPRSTEQRTGETAPDRIEALEARVAHVERLLEGFQDSVHRESERHAKMIAELQNQVQPEAMRVALAEDARNRGL